MDYLQNALEITNKLGVEMACAFLKHDFHFQGDKEKRDIYKITLKRGNREFSFNYGQSINNSGKYKGHKHLCLNNFGKFLFSDTEYLQMKQKDKYSIEYNEITLNPNFAEPNMYDIMTCLQKYDVGSFEDFCSDFGYDNDSIALKTYKAVKEEYTNMCMLFTDSELRLLSEIQ